ncbi:HTH_48 domain-containing protein [Trichonephila clavipes]|nr:HTH_48 domain-containing protein [Trichonephila clavipes]
MECHSELVEVLGNNALPYRTVVRGVGKFQQGRVSTSDEQRSGRPVSVWTDLARAVIEQLMDYIKGHGLQNELSTYMSLDISQKDFRVKIR